MEGAHSTVDPPVNEVSISNPGTTRYYQANCIRQTLNGSVRPGCGSVGPWHLNEADARADWSRHKTPPDNPLQHEGVILSALIGS